MKLIFAKVQKYFLPKQFPLSRSTFTLGEKFQQARQNKTLSIAEVARALHFSELVIIALETGEEGDKKKSTLFEPGYFRLAAVTYARFLGVDLPQIGLLLPPPAPLKSSHTTYIKKLSPLQSRPQKAYFIRKEHQLAYSLTDIKFFLWKFFKIIALIVVLFYLWSLVRHLARAFF